MKTDRQIKLEATRKEHIRVFDHMILPARDIYVDCSDGRWMKQVWQRGKEFGWDNWKRC